MAGTFPPLGEPLGQLTRPLLAETECRIPCWIVDCNENSRLEKFEIHMLLRTSSPHPPGRGKFKKCRKYTKTRPRVQAGRKIRGIWRGRDAFWYNSRHAK